MRAKGKINNGPIPVKANSYKNEVKKHAWIILAFRNDSCLRSNENRTLIKNNSSRIPRKLLHRNSLVNSHTEGEEDSVQ